MIEILLTAFMWLLTPIPWVVVAIHVLVGKKLWKSATVRRVFNISVILVWAVLGYWLIYNYQGLFSNSFQHIIAQMSGVIVLIVSGAIEVSTRKALGIGRVFGSSELEQTKDKLITTGIYRYARHPRYVEHPFWFLGLGLLFGYVFLIWFAVYLFIAFAVTAYFEEKELIQRFGSEYLKYKKKTPAFFLLIR